MKNEIKYSMLVNIEIKDRLKKGFRNVKSLLDKINVAYIEVGILDPDKKSFINLNRPEDISQSRE